MTRRVRSIHPLPTLLPMFIVTIRFKVETVYPTVIKNHNWSINRHKCVSLIYDDDFLILVLTGENKGVFIWIVEEIWSSRVPLTDSHIVSHLWHSSGHRQHSADIRWQFCTFRYTPINCLHNHGNFLTTLKYSLHKIRTWFSFGDRKKHLKT